MINRTYFFRANVKVSENKNLCASGTWALKSWRPDPGIVYREIISAIQEKLRSKHDDIENAEIIVTHFYRV